MAATMNESNICRLCSTEFDVGISLFESNNSPTPLEGIINRYLPLKVTDDGKLPKSICPTCNIHVKTVAEFFDIVVAGQRRLRELWKEESEKKRREKRQISKSDVAEDEIEDLVQLIAGNEESLFNASHTMTLTMEGREAPRRKPGRPRKVKPPDTPLTVEGTPEPDPTSSGIVNDIVDPEQALELMFKEAEEKRMTLTDASGRMRRRRKVPQRFEGVVQGKELEAIFKEEGVIGPEEEENEAAEEEVEDDVHDDLEDLQLGEDVAEEDDDEESDLRGSDEEVVEKVVEGKNGENIVMRNQRKTGSGPSKPAGRKSRVGRPRKRRFVCEYCGKNFVHSGHFAHHIRTRHRQSQFICLSCNEAFAAKEELTAHQQAQQHTGEGILDVHNIDLVEDEVAEEPADQQVEFKCSSCQQVFNQQSALTSHIVEQHASNNSSICDLCGKTFSHPSSVIYHKEVAHSKGRSYVCRICNKGFKHKQLLQRHSLVHSEERPFVCHVCGATFKTRANLYNHNAVHNEEKRYQCTYCDAKFSHKTSLVLHTRWHTGEKPFSCNVCGKTFSQGGNLQEHMRIHTGEKPYQCQTCSKRFTTSSQHRLHMKRHTGERPWKCEYCGKDFLHKDSWKCHLRRHRGEKPFSCNFCPRTFTEQWALKKHIRLHTGEKPYQCHVCSKAFSDLSNLQKHRKTHKNVPPVVNEETGGLESLATDGQHIIYVTTQDGEQSQLLISTLAGSSDPSSHLVTDSDIHLVDNEELATIPEQEESTLVDEDPEKMMAEPSTGDEGVLTIVGDGASDEIGQAVEFTTQDGRRMCLIIPPNVDPFEFTTEYLSNLS